MPLLADHPDLTLKRVFAAKQFSLPIQTAVKVNLLQTTGQQILWIKKIKLQVPVNMTLPADSLIIDGQPLLLGAVGAGTTQYLNNILAWTATETAIDNNGSEPLQIRRTLDLVVTCTVAAVLTVDIIAYVADDTDNEFQTLAGPPNID